jgi:glutaredoxin
MDGSGSNITPTPTVEIPKSDKPNVKIFVMSYCPYGLQAEKMMLPVYDLLKDKIDIGIYFVDYAMHGKQELDENLRQYCMQNEDQTKYFDYLSCFIQGGNSSSCLTEAGINLGNLASCISATDATYNVSGQYNDQSTWLHGGVDPTFDVQKDLNELYGVTGSPTIIINGVKVTVSPRTPENFKQIICSAFNTSPEECNQTLSTTVPSAGFD